MVTNKREKAQVRNWKIARFMGTPLLTNMMPIEVLDKLTNKEVEVLDHLQKKLRNLVEVVKIKRFTCEQCGVLHNVKYSEKITKNKKAIVCDYCHSWKPLQLHLIRN